MASNYEPSGVRIKEPAACAVELAAFDDLLGRSDLREAGLRSPPTA
jgi:hypothetical protein